MPIFKRAEAVRTRAALNATAADLSSATTPEARQEVLRRHGVTDVPEGKVKAFAAELRRAARRG